MNIKMDWKGSSVQMLKEFNSMSGVEAKRGIDLYNLWNMAEIVNALLDMYEADFISYDDLSLKDVQYGLKGSYLDVKYLVSQREIIVDGMEDAIALEKFTGIKAKVFSVLAKVEYQVEKEKSQNLKNQKRIIRRRLNKA